MFSPGPTAMKNLFTDEKLPDPNQTLAPDDGSIATIFGTPGMYIDLFPNKYL